MNDTDNQLPAPDQTRLLAKPPENRPGLQKPAKASRARASGSSALGIFFSLVILITLAGVGFYTWEHYKVIEVLVGQYNQLSEQGLSAREQLTQENSGRTQLIEDVAAVEEQLRSAQALLTSQENQLEALNRELITTRLRINGSGAGDSQVWMLAEAESLLRFAQQRLLLSRDVPAATGLFVSADNLLKQINDPAIFPVREALALDLSVLRAVQEADVAGIYARIGALIPRLDTLQPGTPGLQKPDTRVPVAAAASAESGQSWWDKVGAGLGRFFVVSHETDEIVPRLNTDQAWALREVIRLNLEQARVALVRGQPELFQLTLNAAEKGVDLFGQSTDQLALLTELEAVRQLPILTVVPPVNLASTALRQLRPTGGLTSEATP